MGKGRACGRRSMAGRGERRRVWSSEERLRVWSGLLAGLAWIVPQSICDVDVLREDGSGRVATVVQDSAVGWDTTIYPHCVFADEPHFMAIDTDSSKTLSPTELNDDGAGSLMSMDQNSDDLVDVLEFASGAHDYLALKGIAAGGEPNPNITCATCASGWMGQHCNEQMVPVEIKIAVRASQAYFDTQKQEALRRALALGLEWNQVRVVVKSVVTTETEGQLMQAELLAGGDVGRGDPKTAAVFLANAGSNWYQATLWESLWYLHVACPTNCTVRVEGDTRTWRSPLNAKCTGPENQRIYALGEQDCENTRNDNSWFPAEVSRCEDRSAACKDADGNVVAPQPADIGACLDVDGHTWEPTILSSGETEAACKTPASGNLYLPGASGVCVDTTAGNVPTQRVKSANIPAADSQICNDLTDTIFQYGNDYCVNTEGEKANMPLGHNSNKYPPYRPVQTPPLSGPGQDATQSLWFSSDSQVECEETWTTDDYVEPVEGQCIRCKGSDEVVIEPPEENADTDGIFRYKRDCEAVAGQTWELVPSLLTEQTCEWIPRDNVWEEAIEPGCFLGEVQQPQYAVNLTTEKECVTAIHTGTCDGKRGECDCAIGYEGVDCTTPILTPSELELPSEPFWRIVLYTVAVTVAAPCCCASLITIWRKCSHPLIQVAPEEDKTVPGLFMPREMKVADAKGVDVLDMTVLQPIAPAGGVAIGGHKHVGADDEEGILKRFERERKHISINRKVGAQFDLGFPT